MVDDGRTDDGRTTEHGYTISSPCEPDGSGELMRLRIEPCKIDLSSPVILYYRPFQGDTSIVVLFVMCFGIEFLCCLSLMYIFIF